MKKSLLITLLCCSASAIEAQTIHLNVTGLTDGTKMAVKLAGTYVDEEPLQVVEIKNGRAQFHLNEDGPRGYYIYPDSAYGYEMIVVKPGEEATFSANYTETAARNGKRNFSVTNMSLSGSPTNDFYMANKADRASLNRMYQNMHDEYKELLDNLSKAQRGSDEFNTITATDEYKTYAEKERLFFNHVNEVLMAPVHKNKDTWWGPFFLCSELNYLTEQQKPLYDEFSESAKNSFYGKVVSSFVAPESVKGKQMPDFTFTNHATNEKQTLFNICKQNKYVLLDFWASWCGPCRKEIPNFKKQYEQYKDKGFQIVSISADSDMNAWLKALDEEQTPWYNDIDGQQGIAKLYKVSYYPTVYILDSEGKVVAKDKDARGENLQKLMVELFK